MKKLIEILYDDVYKDFWGVVFSGRSYDNKHIIEKYIPEFKNLENCPQNPKYHPEGDVDIHVCMVIDNVSKFKDKNLSLAAVFHDIAKPECLSIKNGQPTAYGHEFMSANVAKKYRNLIEDMGADYNEVIGLILNHMKMHNYNSGKLKKIHKIKQIEELPYFEKLKLFSKADSDRGDHSVS